MSETENSKFSAYDLGSQRQKERYGFVQPIDDEEDETGSSGSGETELTPFTDDSSDDGYKPIGDAWGEALAQMVAERQDDLTRLLMEEEKKFGNVSTKNRKQRKIQDNSPTQEVGLNNGYGAGNDLPQHPFLNGQRYDGMADNDSPLAARNSADDLFENLAEQLEKDPKLQAHPELTPNLKLRIELYNQNKLENALRSRPTLTMDRMKN